MTRQSVRPRLHLVLTPMLAHLAVALLVTFIASGAGAQERQPSTCLAIAENQDGSRVWKAGYEPAQAEAQEVTITYVAHSAFRITTPEGIDIITDYNGYNGAGGLPDVVTMNHAHSSHYTSNPDPAIPHVFRGWDESGQGRAEHYLQLGDVVIRNVSTDLYVNGTMIEQDGNSIFIFEVAGLCIGHLGHLHHKLTPEHVAQIGRLDVLFMPVDGTYTMSQAGMIEIAQMLRSSVIFPMHFFSSFSLQRFLAGMQAQFTIDQPGSNTTTVSLTTLPQTPSVRVLLPY